jgi:adenylate cyclase
MQRRRRKRLLVSIGLALAVAALLSGLLKLEVLSTALVASTDFLFKIHTGARARSTVIVGVDQRSVERLAPTYGSLTDWPRTVYAHALDMVTQAHPRVVVFDIFFDAPKAEDAELAAAIQRAGNVLLPVAAERPRSPPPSSSDGVPEFDVLVGATPELRTAAAGEGLVNVTTDRDSIVRGLPLTLHAGDAEVPSIALVAAARYARRPRVIDAPPDAGHVFAAGRVIPVVGQNRLLVNFLGPPSSPDEGGPFDILSLADVLDGTVDATRLQDRIVMMAVTVPGVDEYAAPSTSATRMWGAEVLTNAMETLLQQRYLAPAPQAVVVAFIFGFALLAAVLVALAPPLLATLGALAMATAYLLSATIGVDNGLILNVVYPPAAIGLAFGVTLAYRVLSEQSEQRLLRQVMSMYLSPSVSRWVLHEPDRLQLGGETRCMSVLFSDVRGFTTLSEAMEPQALVALLNEYMTAMTDVVFRYDGVLDKYIGDAVMAFWNAPIGQPDHALRACSTALDMIDRLRELQSDWQQRGIPILELGIGINSGPMVVGNMGSRQRMAYTVLGDTVNVASRLEGLSKVYGTRVVISQATRDAAGDAFVYRFLDVAAVKGRAEPLSVYEIVGRAGQVDSTRAAALAMYADGIELYRARRWAEARGVFERLQSSGAKDGPSVLYLQRSRHLLANPPPADWDGVFVAETK